MYIIVCIRECGREYFGPFPTEERAKEYSKSFEFHEELFIRPIVVPNCITVTLNY